MFDQRHFYYTFTFTASNESHSGTYTFDGSSDDMHRHYDRVRDMFYSEFGEEADDVVRDDAVRIEY